MSSPTAEELIAKLKSTVGNEVVFQAPEEMGRASFRKYAVAIGDFNPLYTDRQSAQDHGLRDVMAPPTLICDTWQYVGGDINDYGAPVRRTESEDLGGLRAGNDYEFFRPIYPDDVITARWKVKDVYEKTGRSGRLFFQEIEMSFYNQHEELLARNTEILFYRVPFMTGTGGGHER